MATLFSHAAVAGALGIAFFSPIDTTRYFFPWTPIEVSPIGAGRFFSNRGIAVMVNELGWIWLPALVLAALIRLIHRIIPE